MTCGVKYWFWSFGRGPSPRLSSVLGGRPRTRRHEGGVWTVGGEEGQGQSDDPDFQLGGWLTGGDAMMLVSEYVCAGWEPGTETWPCHPVPLAVCGGPVPSDISPGSLLFPGPHLFSVQMEQKFPDHQVKRMDDGGPGVRKKKIARTGRVQRQPTPLGPEACPVMRTNPSTSCAAVSQVGSGRLEAFPSASAG